MKKLFALVLACMMALSLCSFAGADGDVVKLTWAMGTGDVAPADNARVLEALNAYSRDKIGVEVDIQYFTDEQLQTSINAGEVFDIYFTCSWYNNTNQCISQGLFANIADQVKNYPGLYNAMSEDVWELATNADGTLYAIPNKKDYAAMNFITYPAEKAEELGFEIPESINAFSDLTDFLVAWKATLPDGEYPFLVGGVSPGIESSFDFIDRTAMIGCIYGTTKVCSVFDDPAVMERYRTIHDWFTKGIINPDAAQLKETSIDTTKQRINTVQAWTGYDGYTVSNGYVTNMTLYAGPNLSVDSIQGSMNALSVTLEEDPVKMDAALRLFELIHTDKYYADMLRFGEEGYHWNYVTEEQSKDCAGGVMRTQEGKDGYNPWAFAQPAYFFTSIPVSQDQIDGKAPAPNFDQYNQYYEDVKNKAIVSAMGGFKWDSSNFTDNLAEITAIKDQYYNNFASGTISIDDVYDEMIQKMNSAGLQEMIADAQAQLDAYLAAN